MVHGASVTPSHGIASLAFMTLYFHISDGVACRPPPKVRVENLDQ